MGIAEEVAQEAVESERIRELQGALQRAQQKAAKREREEELYTETLYRAVHDALLAVGGPARPIPRTKSSGRKGAAEACLLHLSDWQLGKKTISYDSSVCVQRVRAAVAKTIRLAEIQRADHPVPEIHVMLGGDLVEGVNIFPGQAYEIDSHLYQQTMTASMLVRDLVLELLGAFDKVHVHEVWGNHGRLGRRGEMPRGDNMDRFVGGIARIALGEQKRLVWPEPEVAWTRIVEVGNYRAILFHGDNIRSYGQTPIHAIRTRITKWASGVKEPFNDAYLGHWHFPEVIPLDNGGRIFMSPSTESGSEYASDQIGSLGYSGQRLNFINPRKGRVTAEYLMDLG